eukprot:Skav202196  [mRNA]  locus=scaffold191:90668:91656:- [translate_table: standard]
MGKPACLAEKQMREQDKKTAEEEDRKRKKWKKEVQKEIRKTKRMQGTEQKERTGETRHLGCNVTLVVDEFASKLWEAGPVGSEGDSSNKEADHFLEESLEKAACQEANYEQEAKNAQMFAKNFGQDPTVKIPKAGKISEGLLVLDMGQD